MEDKNIFELPGIYQLITKRCFKSTNALVMVANRYVHFMLSSSVSRLVASFDFVLFSPVPSARLIVPIAMR